MQRHLESMEWRLQLSRSDGNELCFELVEFPKRGYIFQHCHGPHQAPVLITHWVRAKPEAPFAASQFHGNESCLAFSSNRALHGDCISNGIQHLLACTGI